MKYNQLGRAGLFVSEICLGTMTFGGNEDAGMWKAIGALQQDEVDKIVGRALEAGVNFFDTADVYSFGESEKRLGQAFKNLKTKRSDVVIATKVFGEMGPRPNDKGASRGHIMDSVQGSLERLQTDHIDLYQIHGNDSVTPIDETLRALDDLVSQGLVRYIGVSNWAAWKIAKALGLSEAKGYAQQRATERDPPPRTGQWHLASTNKPFLTGDGVPLADVFFEPTGRTMFRSSDGVLWRGGVDFDDKKHTATIFCLGHDGSPPVYILTTPDATHMVLTPTGKDAKNNGTLTLVRVPLPTHYPLEDRGFHWVNEWGLER